MELTPLRVPGIGAVWTLSLNVNSAQDLIRCSKMTRTLRELRGGRTIVSGGRA
jgi:hypothetical protein